MSKRIEIGSYVRHKSEWGETSRGIVEQRVSSYTKLMAEHLTTDPAKPSSEALFLVHYWKPTNVWRWHFASELQLIPAGTVAMEALK